MERREFPATILPAAPAYAAGNPGAGDDGEKTPSEEPKEGPGKPEESPGDGGEKAE
jgi:hypothetical protein